MKRNLRLSVLLTLVIVLMTSCLGSIGKHTYNINFNNNSDEQIAVYIGFDDKSGNTLYPDTALPKNNYTRTITKGEINYNYIFTKEGDFNIVSVFILNQDTINKYAWSEIRDDYKIIKRYDLSKADLIKLNWAITYP